uniref:hypothetical protein n=1 Tax=unclassified Rhodococcus (in: high G+C Gram-positive bacteria) TaxID=192944 RepID=UPI0015962D1F|nr:MULTISPECIES: hypothetical protein [unclassified Rhodococcus (in: high G+C Gram-positive bacteria)]
MRQCRNDTDAWRDGSAYRTSGRRIGHPEPGRARDAGYYDGERQGCDPDVAETD